MTKKPQLLYVITQGEWGGAQRYIYDLARNLHNDYAITIAVGEPGGASRMKEVVAEYNKNFKDPILFVQLKHLVRRISIWHDLAVIPEIIKLIRNIRPKIVHLNSSKAGIIGSVAATLSFPKPKTVYTVHGWVFNEPMSWVRCFLYQFFERITAHFKDKIITLSKFERDQAASILHIPQTKLAIIPIGIAPFAPLLREEARAAINRTVGSRSINLSNTLWAGTIANYYPSKGLDVLLEAIATEADNFGKVNFFLIGDGEERQRLSYLIKVNNITNVHLVGSLPNAANFLTAFDFFVLPSRKEGMPYALLEALYCRLPVIATKVGAIPEILGENNEHRLVLPGDRHALGKAIREMQNAIPKTNIHGRISTLTEMAAATNSIYHSL